MKRFYRTRNDSDEESALEPFTLPRFSFEGDGQIRTSFISTSRDEHSANNETAYDLGTWLLHKGLNDDREIVV